MGRGVGISFPSQYCLINVASVDNNCVFTSSQVILGNFNNRNYFERHEWRHTSDVMVQLTINSNNDQIASVISARATLRRSFT